MGTLKDIIDLAKDLEASVKERKDLDILRQIHSFASEIQSKQLEIMERDIRLMEENSQLKAQLQEKEKEVIRFHKTAKFVKSKQTGNKWVPFCPNCGMPANGAYGIDFIGCSANCGWESDIRINEMDQAIKEIEQDV